MADPMVKFEYGNQTHMMLNNARKQVGSAEVIFNSYEKLGHAQSDEVVLIYHTL